MAVLDAVRRLRNTEEGYVGKRFEFNFLRITGCPVEDGGHLHGILFARDQSDLAEAVVVTVDTDAVTVASADETCKNVLRHPFGRLLAVVIILLKPDFCQNLKPKIARKIWMIFLSQDDLRSQKVGLLTTKRFLKDVWRQNSGDLSVSFTLRPQV